MLFNCQSYFNRAGTKKIGVMARRAEVWSGESNLGSYYLRALAVILSGPSSPCCSQEAEREALTSSHPFTELLRPDASTHMEVTL